MKKPIVVHFDFPGGTQQQYNALWDDLRASGNSRPEGLLFHVGAGKPGGGILAMDVWESEEAFKAFANTLLPFIQKQGFEQVQPVIMPVYYLYDEAEEEIAHQP